MKLGLILVLAGCFRAAAVRAGPEQSLEAGLAGKAEVALMGPEEGEAKKEDAGSKEVDVGTNIINFLKPFTGEGWVNFEVDDESKGVVKQISQLATGFTAFLALVDPGPVGKAASLGLTIIAGILPGVFNVEEPLPNNLLQEFNKLHQDLDGIKQQIILALGYLRKIDDTTERQYFQKEEGFRNAMVDAFGGMIRLLGQPNGRNRAAHVLQQEASHHVRGFNKYRGGFVDHMDYILQYHSKAAAVLFAQQNLATQIQAVSYLYTWRVLDPEGPDFYVAGEYLDKLRESFKVYTKICNEHNLWPWLRVGAEELSSSYGGISLEKRLHMNEAAAKLNVPDSDSRTTALRELLSSWPTKEAGALLAEPLTKVLAKTKGGLIKSRFISRWHERNTYFGDNLGFCLGYASGGAVQASPCRGGAAQLWHFDGPLLRSRAADADPKRCLHYNPSDEKLYAEECAEELANQQFLFEGGILKTKFDLGLCLELREKERVGESHQVAMTRSCQETPSTQWYFFAAEGAQLRSLHDAKNNWCLTYHQVLDYYREFPPMITCQLSGFLLFGDHPRYTAQVAKCSESETFFHMLGDAVQFRVGSDKLWMPPAWCLMSWNTGIFRAPVDFYPCAKYKPAWPYCDAAQDIVYDEESEELRVQNSDGQCLDWDWDWRAQPNLVVLDKCQHLNNQRWVLTRDDCKLAVDALERLGPPAAQEAIRELGDIARQQHWYDDRAGRCIKAARKLLKVLAPPTDWKCHTLEDWQDETWCDTRGVQPDGMEYALVRPAQETSCGGCGCCKREVSALGLGPTVVPSEWHWACHHPEAGQRCPTTPQRGLVFQSSEEGGVVGKCGKCACCQRPAGAAGASLMQQEEIAQPAPASGVRLSNVVTAADQAALSPAAVAAGGSRHTHVVSATEAAPVSNTQLQSNETAFWHCECEVFAENLNVPVWTYCGTQWLFGDCVCHKDSGLCPDLTERFKTIEASELEEEFECTFNLRDYKYHCKK